MPQQLIYTSAPRGVVAGRSGHCTVARSATMREALMLQLEKLSYYQHLSLSGGRERPIYSCRIMDIRGSRYHVLTRIQDAGLDFTGRTNFLAHHLVFTPEEIREFASPPVLLMQWSGWTKSWSKEPQLLENEDWSALPRCSGFVGVPAKTWRQLTGNAANGYGLLESRHGIAFRVDDFTEEQILTLFAESLELLELRDQRRDFRATCWQYTFTTSMQEQDNPADFRWRCLHSDNPASNRFAGPDCTSLNKVRVAKATSDEMLFAESGRQPPNFVTQPQNIRSTENETVRIHVRAEGVPIPNYEWYVLDRDGNGQPIAGGTSAELVLQNPPVGVTRYVVRASNSQGEATSAIATLSIEQKSRQSQLRSVTGGTRLTGAATPAHVKSSDEIDRQRRRMELEQAQAIFLKRLKRRKLLTVSFAFLAFLGVGGACLWKISKLRRAETPVLVAPSLEAALKNTNAVLGSHVTFSILPTGTPPLFIQWKHNDRILPGETNCTFVSDGLTAGRYGVTVTNIVGTTNSSAMLNWITPPVDPPFTTVSKGSVAVFSVKMPYTADYKYEWMKDGKAIPGATNAVLKINGASETDESTNYAVVVKLAGHRAESSPATLTVQNKQLSDPSMGSNKQVKSTTSKTK